MKNKNMNPRAVIKKLRLDLDSVNRELSDVREACGRRIKQLETETLKIPSMENDLRAASGVSDAVSSVLSFIDGTMQCKYGHLDTRTKCAGCGHRVGDAPEYPEEALALLHISKTLRRSLNNGGMPR